MKQSRATIRYAKSLIDISEENGVIDSSYDDMLLINSLCLSNKDLVNLLKTPIVKTPSKILLKRASIRMEGGRLKEVNLILK